MRYMINVIASIRMPRVKIRCDRVAMCMSRLLAKTIDALANGCFHYPVALQRSGVQVYNFIISWPRLVMLFMLRVATTGVAIKAEE